MLTKTQISELKHHLELAQNPVFFFDNDQDGLCSFLLLQRYIGRGKGVPIKSFPDLTLDYFRRVKEFNSDYIFILDKPVVSKAFFDEAEKINIPVVWVDHHLTEDEIPNFVHYYNPLLNKKKNSEPVTALCYQLTQKKEDMWLAVVGCISDRYVPDFYSDFQKKYPDLAIKSKNAFDIFYNSDIGKISRIFSFGLKDRTTNVINMIRFLINAKSPYEVLTDNTKNRAMHNRYDQIDLKYKTLLKKAKSTEKEKLLFFKYSGDLSISSDLANELIYTFPDKIIAVVYVKGLKANISMRGKNVREIFLNAIKDLEEATGGGHEEAIGGQMNVEQVEQFKANLCKLI